MGTPQNTIPQILGTPDRHNNGKDKTTVNGSYRHILVGGAATDKGRGGTSRDDVVKWR